MEREIKAVVKELPTVGLTGRLLFVGLFLLIGRMFLRCLRFRWIERQFEFRYDYQVRVIKGHPYRLSLPILDWSAC